MRLVQKKEVREDMGLESGHLGCGRERHYLPPDCLRDRDVGYRLMKRSWGLPSRRVDNAPLRKPRVGALEGEAKMTTRWGPWLGRSWQEKKGGL